MKKLSNWIKVCLVAGLLVVVLGVVSSFHDGNSHLRAGDLPNFLAVSGLGN
jgi:hypothetical protein